MTETDWCCSKHQKLFEKAAKELDPYDPMHAVCTFLEGRVEFGRAYEVIYSDLYDAYSDFSNEKGFPVESKRMFSMCLGSAIPSFRRVQRGAKTSMTYQGMRLREVGDEE